jgi:anti-sigma28 factor (negative regulator of flagellin synthesis)
VEDDSPSIAKGKEYIRKVVENCLLDEGQAQIVACKTAKELEAAGETGISIPGANSDKYKEIYEKIEAGTLTMDQGRKEMAKVMATETTSNSSENYIDYYSKDPREDWNAAHPDAEVPETPRIAVFP